jgi:TolB protein
MLRLPAVRILALVAGLGASGHAPLLHADSQRVIIDVTQPKRALYPLAIPLGTDSDGQLASTVQQVATFDMQVAGWFKTLEPRSFLADLAQEGLGLEPQKWKDVGAFGVIKYRATSSGNRIELLFRLYEVEKGARPVLERSYRGNRSDARSLTHQFCNEVVKYYTGEDGFFGSRIAFTATRGKGGKIIGIVDFDGASKFTVTPNRSINILPAWSPDGSKIAFTAYRRPNPDLYVVSSSGGSPRQLSGRPGLNSGATWSPDGSKIALTLSKDGNPEIYVIDASGGDIISRLTSTRHIDTSPAWSPDGREIAFVSDREGGPQIFLMNADGSNQRRVSMNGPYNTTPSWAPVRGKRILAYTTRDGGRSDVVTLNLDSGEMVRITQNEGSNETPSFSPNGRAIAFASIRSGGSGVFIANADGTGKAVQVYSGKATSVAWGPMPR